LHLTPRAQRNVNIPSFDRDAGESSIHGGVAGDVSSALTMSYNPQSFRPALLALLRAFTTLTYKKPTGATSDVSLALAKRANEAVGRMAPLINA
jgi:hypothetical protein